MIRTTAGTPDDAIAKKESTDEEFEAHIEAYYADPLEGMTGEQYEAYNWEILRTTKETLENASEKLQTINDDHINSGTHYKELQQIQRLANEVLSLTKHTKRICHLHLIGR